MQYPVPRQLDTTSLYQYLQLTYIPAPHSIFQNVYKLMPGEQLQITSDGVKKTRYYSTPTSTAGRTANYEDQNQKKELSERLDAAVKRRLRADVPLGAFLSGGIDSSIVTSLAAQHQPSLNTFTIGFSDAPQYDETEYANAVAEKWDTNHHVFSLHTTDLYDHLEQVLNHLDEPFADSSALPVYILSKKTRSKVKVALSGDGGDELFAGYQKHRAAYLSFHKNWKVRLAQGLSPLWKRLPKSRHQSWTNKVRQLHRFAQGARLSPPERYWYWCTFSDETAARQLLARSLEEDEYRSRKQQITQNISDEAPMAAYLDTDLQFVLPNDMLKKVDQMAMANSLEVRVPLLDHEVVEYVQSLSTSSKIDAHRQKKLLLDTFQHLLPEKIYQRPKQGFEVPLLSWFRNELYSKIDNEWLHPEFIREQGIFDVRHTEALKQKLFSYNPHDVHFDLWKLIVFQHWYQRFMNE
jgi:asparagine synthase (glutamine-hydrolysing)